MDQKEELENVQAKKGELSKMLIWVSITSCLIYTQYGYNTWILNSTFVFRYELYNITISQRMDPPASKVTMMLISMALFPIGATFGSLPTGYLVDKFGRKGASVIVNISFIIFASMMCASLWIISYWYFFLTRFYHGICTGMLFIAVPLYLGEISPKSLRGGIIMMVLVFYIIGVLLGQILSLQEVFGTQKGVPVLLNLTWVMPVFQILLLPFFPESPRYLFIQKKDEVRARQALKKLRDRSDVEDEIEELHQEDLVEKAEKNMTPLKLLLKTPKLRWQVITIIVLMGGQQVDGISVAYLYKEKIFMSMMLGENEIHFALIGTTVFYCFSSILGVYFADSKGHRILLVTGFGICCIISVLLNMTLGIETAIPEIVYFTLIFINIFMFGHAIGPGSLPSVLVAELFLQSSRSSAFVIAGVMKWLTNFLVGVIVLYVERNLGAYSFTIFCPVLIAIFIYVFKFIPETKNKTFLDIRRLMGIHNGKKIDIKEQTDK